MPSEAAVSATERASVAAVPSGNGCASASSGWIQDSPCCSSGQDRSTGEPAPSGWTAEHGSCRNPGSVSSSVRAPPPTVSAPS